MATGNISEMLREGGYDPHHDLLSKLPNNVKKRISALKSLQIKSIELEAEFYSRVHALEREFEVKFAPHYEERRKIVNGERDPTEEEGNYPLLHGADEHEIQSLYSNSDPDTDAKGIKDFWLTEHDEPILSYLTDVTSNSTENPSKFVLNFHFASNPYFKNSVLTKEYILNIAIDKNDPFNFDGPQVERINGAKIEWEDGKDVTKKAVKKKQKRGANAGKYLTKTVKAESFFNFFESPKNEDEKNEDDEEDHDNMEDILIADYEVGQIIRDTVISRAVLLYTGELATEDPDMFDFDGEDGEGSEDEEDEE
ncbi:unnamed protein product [Caenorhabditis auriculariae]|uniref:Nucleosome assembly protein n=1 Tax=Caenorhabditis auriculariae TaxID=2777116 RepID=A0A8S1H8G7_9PELO|nr:unnamed protein product [Caenorhabditis auriculariae]